MAEGGPQLEPGAIFAGDYRVVRTLAEGGMGAVYVVDQLSTGKSRALKLMRPEVAHDAASRQRFELEARVGARIQSDHVVEIHSAGVDNGTPYLVMEMLDGEDLESRIQRGGALAATEARDLFEQLCHAISAAHSAGIVHRDLKPANIFLQRTKRAGDAGRLNVKVLDFGIAKLVAESQTRGQTVGMIGTPAWMAPEQTELGKITAAADIWALGLILYYVLTGQSYWLAAGDPQSTLTQLLKEMVMGPLPPASQRARAQGHGGSIPPEVEAIIGRCLMRDPKQRLDDAQVFWSALSSALAAPSSGVLAAGPSGPIDRTVRGPTSRASAPIANTEQAGPLAAGHSPWGQPQPLQGPPFGSTPRFEPAPFSHRGGMSSPSSWDRRLLGIPLVLFMMIGMQQCFSRVSRANSERAARQAEAERGLITLPTRPTSTVLLPPISKATARTEDKTCRLCTTNVVVGTGPVPRDAIVSVLDAAVPTLDQQCLSRRRRPGAAVITFVFVVREGRAGNRRIDRSSATDGIDECLLRGLADLAFPSSPDETEVTATFAYNVFR